MNSSRRAGSHRERQGNINHLLTPEMRRRVHQLKHGLDQYHNQFVHLGMMTISEALYIAIEGAQRLLTCDPVATGGKSTRDEFDEFCGKSRIGQQEVGRKARAAGNVKRLVTRPMVQQVTEATERLEEYARCLGAFVDDVVKLDSFNTVVAVAQELQDREPFDTKKPREIVVEPRLEDELDGL